MAAMLLLLSCYVVVIIIIIVLQALVNPSPPPHIDTPHLLLIGYCCNVALSVSFQSDLVDVKMLRFFIFDI